jgi:2-oxoglutarate ferredoxin oxidoreductase subunit delta
MDIMRSPKRNHLEWGFIWLDTRRCKACWKCLSVCPRKVIGKVAILWHKHVRIANADACLGCLQCVKVCKSGALVGTGRPDRERP